MIIARIQNTMEDNPKNGHSMTLDGLTKEDIYEIASCALCMLPEEDYQTLINS